MSYQQFQQRCEECGVQWNAAFGVVGQSIIAQPPTKCPMCESPKIAHAEWGWKMEPINQGVTEEAMSERTSAEGENILDSALRVARTMTVRIARDQRI